MKNADFPTCMEVSEYVLDFLFANIYIRMFFNPLQPSGLPVGPVPLHSHHLSSVRRHTAVPPYCAIVCHHGDNWSCHGGD